MGDLNAGKSQQGTGKKLWRILLYVLAGLIMFMVLTFFIQQVGSLATLPSFVAIAGICIAILAAAIMNIRQTASVETRLIKEIAGVETKMTKEISGIETQLSKEVAGVETRLTKGIAGVETGQAELVTSKLSALAVSLDQKIAQLGDSIGGLYQILAISNEQAANDIDHLFSLPTGEILPKGENILTPAVKQLFQDNKEKQKTPHGLATAVLNSLGKDGIKLLIKKHEVKRPESLFVLFDLYSQKCFH